jgi:urea transport system ATP-binding protein
MGTGHNSEQTRRPPPRRVRRIQPSIIKEIGRAIAYLRDKGGMAILLFEQCFAFARDLADGFAVMDRGEIVMAGEKSKMDEAHVRRHLTV